MARIQHVSLENYRQGHFFPADVVIRIVDESALFGSDRPAMETHHFVFGDLDENQPSAIQSSQADQIVTILKTAQEAQHNVLVHCVAGVSRSGAVAQFAVDFLGFEDANHQRNWRIPNAAVLKALKRSLLGDDCPFFKEVLLDH